MMEYSNETFRNHDFAKEPCNGALFEGCRFEQCNFFSAALHHCRFIDCVFADCQLASANFTQAMLNDVVFQQCKIMGVRFDSLRSTPLSVGFEGCVLDLSSFYRLNLSGTSFERCSLREVDFTEADLQRASFEGADLTGAQFDECNLEEADFRQTVGCVIYPNKNKIRKARFSISGLPGLLQQYGIVIEDSFN